MAGQHLASGSLRLNGAAEEDELLAWAVVAVQVRSTRLTLEASTLRAAASALMGVRKRTSCSLAAGVLGCCGGAAASGW